MDGPSAKKITRKELRRPDAFIILTSRLFHLYQHHKPLSIAVAALFIVFSLSLWGWNLYRARQDRLAGQEYSRALVLYRSGKYREAMDALARVSAHRSSLYGRLALLYQANSHIALNEPARAVTALEELLGRERTDPLLRQLGLLTLGSAHEKAGQCKEAAVSFTLALKTEGPFKEEALLGKARCAAEERNLQEALNSYKEYLANYPGSERIHEISLRVKELEGTTRESAEKK